MSLVIWVVAALFATLPSSSLAGPAARAATARSSSNSTGAAVSIIRSTRNTSSATTSKSYYSTSPGGKPLTSGATNGWVFANPPTSIAAKLVVRQVAKPGFARFVTLDGSSVQQRPVYAKRYQHVWLYNHDGQSYVYDWLGNVLDSILSPMPVGVLRNLDVEDEEEDE